jgi:hypothetical protein
MNMDMSSIAGLRDKLDRTVGPAPWYWKTFPALRSAAGQRFIWTYHGKSGPLAYLVSLALEQEPEKPRLALNTYSRPFLVPPAHLGVWCPESQNIRFACFDPDQLKAFDFAEIAGWFKQSSERIYAATPPIADFEVLASFAPGTNQIDVPSALQTVEELIVPTSCPANSSDHPAMALYVFYLHAGLVEVLPQKWFTAAQYEVGKQWITRAARDPGSHRIFGECFGSGAFLLEQDGCRIDRWLSTRELNH